MPLGRLRQEESKFKVSLGYRIRLCLKQPKSRPELYLGWKNALLMWMEP